MHIFFSFPKKSFIAFITNDIIYCILISIVSISRDHSVIPAAVKTPGNKFAGIIMPRINMVAVKTPDQKFA